MEDFIELNKYRKQLNYIDRLFDVLQDEDDGNLYENFSEKEENKFIDFIEFMNDIQYNIEKKLKIVEKRLKTEEGKYESIYN